MRVCHIISGDLWAGAEVQAFAMLRSLATLPDIELSAIVLNEGTLTDKLKNIDLKVTVCDESKFSFFELYRRIRQILIDNPVDILHSHRYKENILGGLLKKRGMVRHLVQTVHGLNEPFKGIRMLKAKLYFHLSLYYTKKYFDKVQTVSFDIERQLNRRIDPARLVTIHNSINFVDIETDRTACEIKRELDIGENLLIIGSAGRMVPIKGFDVFLETAKKILEKRSDVRFILAGDGPLLEQLKSAAIKLGIQRDVMFLGFRDDAIDVLNMLDVFVLSSYHEGIPTVLLEAMALGKAVVATDVGGIPEVIENDVSGKLVASGNTDLMACACIQLLKDQQLSRQLGSAARDRVRQEFSAETQCTRTMDIYRRLAVRR